MELKPCPFCGGEGKVSLFMGSRCVTCTNCDGAIMPFPGMTESEAIESWNRRYEPPNEPLTMEELLEMNGKPVWITWSDGVPVGWVIVRATKEPNELYFWTYVGGVRFPYEKYGESWVAYRQNPKQKGELQ